VQATSGRGHNSMFDKNLQIIGEEEQTMENGKSSQRSESEASTA